MEKGSNFVEMLAGFRGWFGWDRSAAATNSERFRLKSEVQAIRYGHFREVFRLSDSASTFLIRFLLWSCAFLASFTSMLTFYAAFPLGSLLLMNLCCNPIGAEIKSNSKDWPRISEEQPRTKQPRTSRKQPRSSQQQ